MAKAQARHILVYKLAQAKKIKKDIIENKMSFEKAAKKFSKCPSGKQGGDLGTFSKGEMVKEFDKVVFTAELNRIVGPIKTEFGFHLIEVLKQ